ncbi:unnamed protein product [Adineta steineri]|uniref:Cation/H+ exchanger transmembrane domain-containing protein n=1 Tax=Adineta steineri TaxID=433720 RepID=A0A815QDC1_9BILA|nr:unnamed protein product [Adineta steineri]
MAKVTLFEDPHTSALATFLMQVFITLVVCKVLAKILSYIRQPQVIGQIIAGIIFGPSILGQLSGWTEAIWPAASLPIFQLVANLGLIFFMFYLGLELDLQQIKKSWKTTIPIVSASIIFPVGIGCAVALWFWDMNTGIHTSKIAFILFVASGFGFSAFPVLATLLNAMGLLNKPIGVQTISLAAVEDIAVWVVLAIASAFSSGGSALQGLYTLLLTLGFLLIMFLIVRPILKWIHKYYLKRGDDTNVYLVVICFLLLVVCAFTTEVMTVHAFFGAFISGLCIPRDGELAEFLGLRIQLIVVEFFLPLYFANSGLNTHLNLLTTGKVWWTLVVLLLLASAAKILPVTLMSKLCLRKPWHYCLSIGVLMNTRGIVQLVVLNVGVQLGVLSPIIFALFVLMATILTFITSPVLYLLYRKDFDIKKLSNPNLVVEGQTLIRQENISMSDLTDPIQTISDGDIGDGDSRRGSSKLSRESSTNIHHFHGLGTIEEGINYSPMDPDPNMQHTSVLNHIVHMPINPRRSAHMIHF